MREETGRSRRGIDRRTGRPLGLILAAGIGVVLGAAVGGDEVGLNPIDAATAQSTSVDTSTAPTTTTTASTDSSTSTTPSTTEPAPTATTRPATTTTRRSAAAGPTAPPPAEAPQSAASASQAATAAPAALIAVRSLNFRRRFARLRVSCAGAARGAVGILALRTADKVRGKRRRLGSRSYRCINEGTVMVLKLRLYPTSLRLIRGKRRLAVVASFDTADEEGRPVTGRSAGTVKLR